MTTILVFDLGTTYFKAALIERSGRLLHVVRIVPPIRRTTSGLMELDAPEFAATIRRAIDQLRRLDAPAMARIEAITFASQTNSFLLLDRHGCPITPILLWPDRRAAALEPEIDTSSSIPRFSATTGIPELSAQFMVAKLMWIRRQQPDLWQAAAKLCLISDYFTLLLAERHVTEAGAAGLTGLVDIRHCRWWPIALERFAIPAVWLPELVRPATDLGPVGREAAQAYGLPKRCRLVVGCLDQYAGAIGLGNVEPGIVSETTGTVLATVQCTNTLVQDASGIFQGPAFGENRYYRMVFGDISATYLHWYRDQLADRPDFDELTCLAASVEPGSAGLRLRTAAGATRVEDRFDGIAEIHERGHFVRCIMETVARALADQVREVGRGALPTEVRSGGGAAHSRIWLQIKADMLGIPFFTTECPEPTSMGAAMLAEAALRSDSVRSVAGAWLKLKPPCVPAPETHKSYQELNLAALESP